MFELTRRHMPSIDIVHLLDMVVVNVLACNTDAHAKNYAIIIRGNGASIAPMYDLMCGEVLGERDKKPRTENRRQEPGRSPQWKGLAAIRA